MDLTCDIVRDLLPLYYDGVCSEDSRQLIDGHLAFCPDCQTLLESFDPPLSSPTQVDDTAPLRAVRRAWKKARRTSMGRGILAAVLALAVLIGGFFTVFAIPAMEGGNSMEPTLHDGDRYLLNRLDRNYNHGDILCVLLSRYDDLRDMVRLVALPGDTVEIRDGTLLVNGVPSPSFAGVTLDPGDMTGPVVLGMDEYFVMGDNHDWAVDSRHDRYGTVSSENIFGKLAGVWRPVETEE